ncbi:MAG: hypothetical protein ISR65_02405 [Bacteriovoracaceae bacterium]|nr:hypothetical protein [Bacteriovoracaceae bacterium]
MRFYLTTPNVIILLSIVVYFIYDYFDGKQIKDEREELIKLKTFEFVQKANTFALLLLSIAYFFTVYIDGMLIIVVLIVSSLYTEIFAKLYYRKKY